MALQYLGSLSLADLSPGLGGRIAKLLSALATLRAALSPIQAGLSLQADAAASLKLGLSAAILADISAQLDASLSVGANISLAIEAPQVYLAGLLTAAIDVQAMLSLPDLSAVAMLSADLSANAAVAAQLSAEKLVIEGLIEAAAQVQIVLLALLDILGVSLSASLDIEAQITANGALQVALTTPGIALYRYDGAVSGMGGEVTTALSGGLPGIGIPAQNVMSLVLIAGSPGAQGALEFAFKTT